MNLAEHDITSLQQFCAANGIHKPNGLTWVAFATQLMGHEYFSAWFSGDTQPLKYTSPFINRNEVGLRLDDTIVRYNGEPVKCILPKGIGGDSTDILIKNLATGALSRIQTGDPGLDISSPKLGYVNDPMYGAIYCARSSSRTFWQGIKPSYLRVIDIQGQRHDGLSFDLGSIRNAIVNKYPTFQDCLTIHRPKWHVGQAWCRQFAIGVVRDIPIVFARGIGLGPYSPAKNSVSVRKCVQNLPLLETLKTWMDVCT